MSGSLYNEVRSSLRAEGLPSFGELGPTERQVLVSRARAALDKSDAYKSFRDAAWRAVDSALDDEAEDVLSHRAGTKGGLRGLNALDNVTREAGAGVVGTGGKVGAIVDIAASSAASLLSRWPAQPGELLWLLNALLPAPL
eukprot:1342912-Prymnesium_polylepis.1